MKISLVIATVAMLLVQPLSAEERRCLHTAGGGVPAAVVKARGERTVFRVAARQRDVVMPQAVDNSRLPYFPPIIDQQGGSCAQAAGIGYMFTYELNRLLDRDASVADHQMSYQFAWNILNDGIDQGGFVEEGLNLARSYGIMSVADYGRLGVPFYAWPSGYDKYVRAMRNRAAEVLTFADSIPLVKRWLYDAGDGSRHGGVVTFSIQSTGWRIDDDYAGPSATGYHSLLTRLGNAGAHALTIAGYDDLVEWTDADGTLHRGAFIVVNSWGTHSHDNGRFYLPYDFFRDPGVSNLELSNSMNAVRACTYEPCVVYRVEMSHTSRDDVRLGMAASTRRDVTSPSTSYYYCTAFYHNGGDHPMQGQYRQSDIELAMDFSSQAERMDGVEQYFLSVVTQPHGTARGTGEVRAAEVVDMRGATEVRYPYRGKLPVPIEFGSTTLRIQLHPVGQTSVSSVRWQTDDGQPIDQTLQLRTASGRAAKLRVETTDDGAMRLHYKILAR